MAVGVESEMKKLVESYPAMVLRLMHWTKLAKHGISAEHVRLSISNHVFPTMSITKLALTQFPCVLTVNLTQATVL